MSKEEKGEVIEINTTDKEEIENDGIQISSDVIAVIAGVAVSEVQGVAGMSGGFAGGITEVFSGKKNLAKGIKVDVNGKKAKLDVNIIVEYGSRIPEVAYEIQNRIKKSVETMSGLTVEEVNVHVQGVNTDSTITKKENQDKNVEDEKKDKKEDKKEEEKKKEYKKEKSENKKQNKDG